MAAEGPKETLVVIGAGIMGISTAFNIRRLQETQSLPQLDIVIVDRLGVAKAASGRAGGFIANNLCEKDTQMLASRSFILYEELSNMFGSVAIEYRKLEASVLNDCQTKEGLPEWVDGPAITSSRSIGTTETTAQVHPRKITESMFRWLEEQPLSLGSFKLILDEVSGLDFNSTGNVIGVRLTTGNQIKVDKLALCLGPWMDSAASWFEGANDWNELHRNALKSITARRAHSLLFQLQPDIQARFTPHALFGGCDIYPRPNEVYVCETEAVDEKPPVNPNDFRVDDNRVRQLIETCASTSTLLDCQPTVSTCCYLPVSSDRDSVPLIGQLAHNVYVAGGHSCWGILMAPITGVLMAAVMMSKQDTLDPELAALIPEMAPTRESIKELVPRRTRI